VSTLSAREIAEYAYQAGFRGERLSKAVAVAIAESNGVTNAKGDTTLVDGKWGPSIGLWQIRSLRPSQQETYPDEYRLREQHANLDPSTNAKHAFALSDHGTDWSKWSTYGGTRYHEVMDRARAAAKHVTDHPPTGQNPRGDADRERGGNRGTGSARPGRVVLDLAELAGLEKFFADAADRVRHTRSALSKIENEVETASSTLPEPALATLIRDSFDYLASPTTLRKAEARLDWHARYAARVRRLAERADGPDDKWSRADTFRFLNQSLGDGKIDHAERTVLEALLLGRIVRNRRDLGSHLDRSGGRGSAPSRLPSVNLDGLRNARVPESRLAAVGDGERMLKPVAKQFLRMKAAARAAGIDLHVNDGYRNYAEQAHLYELYQSGRGNLAAPPGQSNHGLGISVDINVPDQRTYQWLVKHADDYGFVNDVPSEKWHWTYKPRG
jgi:hypothetical protein